MFTNTMYHVMFRTPTLLSVDTGGFIYRGIEELSIYTDSRASSVW
jgi:hypothetical protein